MCLRNNKKEKPLSSPSAQETNEPAAGSTPSASSSSGTRSSSDATIASSHPNSATSNSIHSSPSRSHILSGLPPHTGSAVHTSATLLRLSKTALDSGSPASNPIIKDDEILSSSSDSSSVQNENLGFIDVDEEEVSPPPPS